MKWITLWTLGLAGCDLISDADLRAKILAGSAGSDDTGAASSPSCPELLADGRSGYSVGEGVDYHYETIQEAVDTAQDGDLICVAPGTYNENVEVSGKNLWIMSTGSSADTFVQASSAGPALSVLDVDPTETTDMRVQGLTFTGGSGMSAEDLGDIEPWWETVDYEWWGWSVSTDPRWSTGIREVQACSDDAPFTVGGGLVVYSSTVALSDISLEENTSCEGGGAWFGDSTASWEVGAVQGNTAGAGGGIGLRHASLTIMQITLTDNGLVPDPYAPTGAQTSAGGGLGAWGGSALYGEGITVEDNHAYGGGGIFTDDGSLELVDSGVVNHSSVYFGAGIYSMNTDPWALSSVQIAGNSAMVAGYNGTSGGGAYLTAKINAQVQHSQFSNNEAYNGGGIFYVTDHHDYTESTTDGQISLASSVFSNNDSTWDGGALYIEGSAEVKIDGTAFTGVSGDTSDDVRWGAGVYVLYTGAVTVTNSVFASHREPTWAVFYGYAVYSLAMDRVAFIDNEGGIQLYLAYIPYGGPEPSSLNHLTLVGNEATSESPGYDSALQFGEYTEVDLADSVVAFNANWDDTEDADNVRCMTATRSDPTVTISNSTFYTNDGISGVSGCDIDLDESDNHVVDPLFVSYDPYQPVEEWDLRLCLEGDSGCDASSPVLGTASDGGDPGAYGRSGDTTGPPAL